jgi:hypothetical protein
MGIDIIFTTNYKVLGIDDPACGCFPTRAMMAYLPDELCPMMHLPCNNRRGACPRELRNYVELLREFTRHNDPTWAINHPKWSNGVYALHQFIRTAKKYLEHDVGAYVSY